MCYECGKFMGQHVFEYDTKEGLEKSKQKARDVIKFMNDNDVAPMCDICTTTKGFTTHATMT